MKAYTFGYVAKQTHYPHSLSRDRHDLPMREAWGDDSTHVELDHARLALAVLCISVWWGLGSSNAFAYTATFTEVSRTTTPGGSTLACLECRDLGRIARQGLVMWGGSGGNFFNDIVALGPGTGAWITLDPNVNCPGNTSFAPPNGSDENGLAWDPIGGRLWIYNGGSGYRCATPQSVGRIAGPGTTPTAIVDSTLSPTTNYTDWQVRAPDGNKAYVTAFNPTTKTLTLSTPLAVAAGGAYDLYVDLGRAHGGTALRQVPTRNCSRCIGVTPAMCRGTGDSGLCRRRHAGAHVWRARLRQRTVQPRFRHRRVHGVDTARVRLVAARAQADPRAVRL